MKVNIFLNLIREFPKPFYRLIDFEKIFRQSKITVQKSIERLVGSGLLQRLGKDIYIPTNQPADLTKIAHLLYAPNYLSFESVLFKHGVIDQPLFGATFATTRRSKKIELGQAEYWFSRIKPVLWWGFKIKNGVLEADLEKAMVDMLYLKSRGQRHFETDEWYLKPVNRQLLKTYLRLAKIKTFRF